VTAPPDAPPSRELVVTRAALLALGAASRGETAVVGELTSSGVVDADGRPSEAAAPTAESVGSPLVTLRVSAVGPGGTRAASLWVGARRAVLHPEGDGPAAVVSVGRSLLPQLLVRTTGLGPRPLAAGPAFVADGAAVAAACRGAAPAPWPGAVERPSLWRVTWQGSGDGDSVTGDVAVLDLGAQGLWRPARGQDDGVSWSPVRSAAVWAALGRLFAVTLDDGPAEPS
jgi:hypothetical protein